MRGKMSLNRRDGFSVTLPYSFPGGIAGFGGEFIERFYR
jgi:hypothetical protein